MSERARLGREAEPGQRGPDVLILLCRELAGLGSGLDLGEIGRQLQGRDGGVRVEAVAGLCRRPRAVGRAAEVGAQRLVLGLCSRPQGEVEQQVALRRAGLEPLAVERVNLGDLCAHLYPRSEATVKAKLLLAAAVARARAFPGSGPENVRPHLLPRDQRISRRALFTLPLIVYQPVVSIERGACVSDRGCRLCAEVCPRGALQPVDGRMLLLRDRCVGCGLCVSECPRQAMRLPICSPGQVEAEVRELLGNPALDPSQPRGIVFLCQGNAPLLEEVGRAGLSYPVGWLPVVLPCAGMVTAGWVLACFALGAAAVAITPCGDGCSWGQGDKVRARLAYCRELMGLLTGTPADVRELPTSSSAALAEALNRPPLRAAVGPRSVPAEGVSLGEPAPARALRSLVAAYAPPSGLVLAHPGSPFGRVEVGAGCTSCGACAEACPSEALALEEDGEGLSLTFDPALCTGCQLCRQRCPEGVLEVAPATDIQRVLAGRTTLYSDRAVRCEACGQVFAAASMLRRIEALLSADEGTAAAMGAIVRRCPSCRLAGVP